MGRTHAAGDAGPHFLLLPFVEQGHMNPMLNLSSQLAAITTLDCKVTFVNATQPAAAAVSACAELVLNKSLPNTTEEYYVHIQDDEFLGDKLQFAMISSTPPFAGGLPPAQHCRPQLEHVTMSSRHKVFKQKLAVLEKLQVLVEKMVLDSKASAQPISCIVCDLFLWKWVQKVADKHGLRLALLVPCNAVTMFIMGYASRIGKEAEMEELLASGFNLPANGDPRQIFKVFSGLTEGLVEARHEYLVNSFEQLEEPLLPFMEANGVRITFIAPSITTAGAASIEENNDTDISVENRRTQLAGSAFVQDEECMRWLAHQKKASVLYVSFGSESVLEQLQVQEIAMGIDQSGHRFLWVVRPDLPAASRPSEDFRRRSSEEGRGLFVTWAPQRAVLQHAAVGAFLTHSGWNSTLESVCCGVPMLCLPLMGDQPVNANLVHYYWKIGLRLQQTENDGGPYVLSRGDVERGVRAVMLPGGCFSSNATHFQRLAQLAVHQAQQNVTSFVHNIF